MSKYGLLFAEELSKGFVESHLWISVFDKPARARFTRLQRWLCCITLLYLFMLVNALWYSSLEGTINNNDNLNGSDVTAGVLTSIVTVTLTILVTQLFRHSFQGDDLVSQHARKISTAETIEMEDWIGGGGDSQSYSQGYRSAGQLRRSHPGIIRLPSDLSKDSSQNEVPAKPGLFRRTQNIHKVAPETSTSTGRKIPSAVRNVSSLFRFFQCFNHNFRFFCNVLCRIE